MMNTPLFRLQQTAEYSSLKIEHLKKNLIQK